MKKLLYIVLILMMAFSVNAQNSRLSTATKMLIAEHAAKENTKASKAKADKEKDLDKGEGKKKQKSKRVFTTILVQKGCTVDDATLDSLGCTVEKRCGTIIFADVPVSSLKAVAGIKGVRRVDSGRKMKTYNDESRKYSMVDKAHEMVVMQNPVADVPVNYRGKGVLVAVIDDEIDFGHPAFRDANGKSRIKQAMTYVEKFVEGEDGEEIREVERVFFNEDNIEECFALCNDPGEEGHGTHVAAVAAGSTDLLPADDSAKKLYGMAPEADLLLYDVSRESGNASINYAISCAFEMADKLQRPLVVNISLGDITAQADGTDDFSVFLKEIMEQHDMSGKIICASSANTAMKRASAFITCDRPIQNGDWTEQRKVACKPETDKNSNGEQIYHAFQTISFYSSDEREFAVKYSFVDPETMTPLFSSPLITPDFINGLDDKFFELRETIDSYEENHVKMKFDSHLSSSNRLFHHISIDECEITRPVEMVCSIYTKDTGMTITTCNPDNEFADVPEALDPDHLYVTPDNEGSMCVTASSPDVISVGAYHTRKDYVNIEGETKSQFEYFDEIIGPTPVGAIAPYSSFRTEKYGLPGPEVIAPGSHILSAFHHTVGDKENVVALTKYNGVDYQWGMGVGTSMSSPAAAGIIALWLQADPTLTTADVRDIIKHTADYDEYCKAKPERAGMGKINALRGLEYILSTTGIETIGADVQRPTKRIDSNGRIIIEKDGRVYNMIGVRVR